MTLKKDEILNIETKFEYVGKRLREATGCLFNVEAVNDVANPWGFNLICNHSWQVLTPNEQLKIAQASQERDIQSLIKDLATRVKQLEK